MLRIAAIAVLAAVWSWFVIIPYAQQMLSRRQGSDLAFGSAPSPQFRGVATPGVASRSQKKRRLVIMMALVMAALITLPLAIVFRGIFIAEHLMFDALLIGYTFLAARAGAVEMEQRRKVAPLGAPRQVRPAGLRVANEA